MKKILLLLIVILVSSLTACQERPTENETTIIDDVETNLDVPSEVTSETSLPSQINGVDIAWHTNISGTLNNNTIIQSDIDQPITLTAVLTHDTKTRYKYFDVVVLLNPDLVTVTEPNDNDTFTGYYTLLNDVSDANLKTALHDLIDDHTVLDYGDLWTALADSDEDPNNPQNVILFYSGTPRSELLHGGDQDDWNREHSGQNHMVTLTPTM
ncbi:MAG: hypothetical protein K9L26_01080 [Candidatus Izimaplasma sp.]|nr:hypothetical protein [Candidatus Izimaplasma bacterium]